MIIEMMETKKREAYIFDEELSLINPLERLDLLLSAWQAEDSNQSIDTYFNGVAKSLLDQSFKYVAVKCIGMTPVDRYIESQKYKTFLIDVLQRLGTLEGRDKYVRDIKSQMTLALEDFDAFRATLPMENTKIPDRKSLMESVEKLKKFFLHSGYDECVEGFNNGSIFPRDLYEVEKIEVLEATLKFSKYHLSKYLPRSQFDALVEKMEAEKQGYSYILGDREKAAKRRFSITLDQVLYDEGIKLITDILRHLDAFVGQSDDKNKIETQLIKLMSVVTQISNSLGTHATDPLKVQVFKELMVALKNELVFRYSEFFDGTKKWAHESLTIRKIKFEKNDGPKIYKAMVDLALIQNNISDSDFGKILEEGYKGKLRIRWIALTKSKVDLDRSLLLTFLKILAVYGFVPQEIINKEKTVNEYIKDRFENSKGLGFTILDSSYSTWKKKLNNDSNDLKQFCDKPNNKIRQQMYSALYQILIK